MAGGCLQVFVKWGVEVRVLSGWSMLVFCVMVCVWRVCACWWVQVGAGRFTYVMLSAAMR
jgi:hypothetical protein